MPKITPKTTKPYTIKVDKLTQKQNQTKPQARIKPCYANSINKTTFIANKGTVNKYLRNQIPQSTPNSNKPETQDSN